VTLRFGQLWGCHSLRLAFSWWLHHNGSLMIVLFLGCLAARFIVGHDNFPRWVWAIPLAAAAPLVVGYVLMAIATPLGLLILSFLGLRNVVRQIRSTWTHHRPSSL